ncbi:Uncharacterised protein [Mycobacterium tuberculosis]|uniref:Uncharacterized protein n=1 Tax=Mycobacterium tuberculosis TaxID=1773 RepID=A0A654U4K1_MYCTX|nr:Uncharacterised protein [Mycobacterium tuberculosis]CKT04847.1 Uncharacterised protein [Mycobacterium tuberculosis]CKV06392.1 Uncharacterised protein [Mycobacterium tuberculosis]CNL38674.1 Uncharacterised protein [Mycobacterium tuberculosis]CNM22569.1 Uncharacterised protein [Mycobacterium tuberculosis]
MAAAIAPTTASRHSGSTAALIPDCSRDPASSSAISTTVNAP